MQRVLIPLGNRRYRAATPEETAAARPATAHRGVPCANLGPATGELIGCGSCGGGVQLKAFACLLHGRCTPAKAAPGITCCADCPDYCTTSNQVAQLAINASGIGDHLLGLTIAKAWKLRHPDRRLAYLVQHTQWVELFDGYDLLTTAPLPHAAPIYPELNYREGWHWCEVATDLPERALPALKPLAAAAVEWAEAYRGRVVLAPLTLQPGSNRDWLVSHWQALERALRRRGMQCVVICAGGDDARLPGFRAPIIAGQPAARMAALLRAAAAVVSNESGMAHLAGALQVPCVVLAAQLDGRKIHGFWPRTTVVQGPLPCSGCRWTGDFWREAVCGRLCASLQSITPAMVLDALAPMLSAPQDAEPPLVPDRDLEQQIRTHLARLVVPATCAESPYSVADRRATMRQFLRHIVGRRAPLVVETGCQRADLDYGAGMSTTILGLTLKGHGGRLVSVDNSGEHVAFCRSRVAGLPVEVSLNDSRNWLLANGQPIDALYLDSQDTYEPGYQECCLEEARLALPMLRPDAAVLIDDTWRLDGGYWGGKGAKAVPFLLSHGWRMVCDAHQALLTRVGNHDSPDR